MEHLLGRGRMAGRLLGGLLLAYGVTVASLFLLAFLMLKFQPYDGKAEIGILVIYALSCFAGGWLCGKKAERKKYLWGLLTGTVYFLLLLAVSGMGDRSVQSGLLQGAAAFLLCAGGGMIGGMTAS